MSIMEVTTRITHKYLMGKSKSELAYFTLEQADLLDKAQREAACPHCRGKGIIGEDPCTDCKGSGSVQVAYDRLLREWKRLGEAYQEIMAKIPKTDTDRMNWLEDHKYFEVGIGFTGKWEREIRHRENGPLKRYFGRSLRAAIDAAIDDHE